MPNGEGLLGGFWDPEYGSTTTQSAVILPVESDSNKYLLFTLSPFGLDTGLHYSVIDMTLNDENGDVAVKNFPLPSGSLTEKMTAVRHANVKDWWVYLHELNSYNFVSFLVKDLIVEGPFYQDIGSKLKSASGEMKISLDGNRLATVSGDGNINLFTLDRCTGLLSEFIDISVLPETLGSYGCSFSPGSNLLYVTTATNQTSIQVLQFDLLSQDIQQSMTTIWSNPFPDYLLGGLQIGPDGRIYVTLAFNSLSSEAFTIQNQHLSVINHPDSIGLSCNFLLNEISLGNHRCFIGLPNMPNYNLEALEGSPCDTVTSVVPLNIDNEVKIYPNPAKDNATVNYNLKGEQGKFVLYNVFGEKIMDYTLDPLSSQIQISVSNLPSGVYLYSIESNGTPTSINKIIILN
jgi:hypothetical protein